MSTTSLSNEDFSKEVEALLAELAKQSPSELTNRVIAEYLFKHWNTPVETPEPRDASVEFDHNTKTMGLILFGDVQAVATGGNPRSWSGMSYGAFSGRSTKFQKYVAVQKDQLVIRFHTIDEQDSVLGLSIPRPEK
ncbi:hypothetical protein ONZ45_g17644 [Pleurotus djamor]|nr:hypothetical protein ONZ45_g17644 [Pleurotus djamor]